jgi:hypothetical protein
MSHICEDCFVELNSHNTKGGWREKKPKTRRCGKCYLEWRREVRRMRNER